MDRLILYGKYNSSIKNNFSAVLRAALTADEIMTEIPYATEKECTYENFIARCPLCGFRNIFNRVTDLQDTEPIRFREVVCLNDRCKQKFNINGDLVSPAFRMLVFDCYPLKEEKKYSYCILNLAQAYEVFFSLYLRVELLFRPFSQDPDQKPAILGEKNSFVIFGF
jgi:hypothetical protein